MEEHENCSGEDCKICEGYEIYNELIEDGIVDFEAFHDTVTMILDEFTEVLIETIGESDVRQGYILAMRDLAEITMETADRLEGEPLSDGGVSHQKQIFVEGDLSEEELNDIIDRVKQNGDEDIEVINVECGVDCGCEPISCLFDDYDDDTDEDSVGVDTEHITNGETSDSIKDDGFLYGQDFVKWMEDKL